MQDSSAKVDFRQSNSIFIKKPIQGAYNPRLARGGRGCCVGAWVQYRIMVGKRVEPGEGVVVVTARSRVFLVTPLCGVTPPSPERLRFPLLMRWV